MSWLRLDDKFPRHEKVLALTDREFRIHVAVLCYCAEYRTEGRVPAPAWKGLGVTKKVADRFVELGLWDINGVGHKVHDYDDYNPRDPTAADRQKRHRSKGNDDSDIPL